MDLARRKERISMAGTIIDYIKTYGTRSFLEEPVNEVDSLILCQLAYLKFDGMVPDVRENKPSVTLQELYKHTDYENLFKNVWFVRHNKRLFQAMLNSRRFGRLKMNGYVNIIETEYFASYVYCPHISCN